MNKLRMYDLPLRDIRQSPRYDRPTTPPQTDIDIPTHDLLRVAK
jgi:hypothetical protein